MPDDVKAMTAELARDPDSLVFLELGESLRARGQTDAAARVALAGLERHPHLADAHDLYARILVDAGDLESAHDEWGVALRLEPRHVGARKGLGFLCFRRGDLDGALDHLEIALSVDPTDTSVVQALHTVRNAAEAAAQPTETPGSTLFRGFEGGDHGILLVDHRGLVFGGALHDAGHNDISESVAAYLAGAAQEAERTSRLLALGAWTSIVVEAPQGHLHVSTPAPEMLLLVKRDRSVPSGRLAVVAERAGAAARAWLERQDA